jgi:serine/threonine protein kinase
VTIPTHIGKYEIERRLGGGGMAEVFLARMVGAEGFTRLVAIKRVLPGYADNADFSAMFVREAQLSARLNHPNIVSVIDFDRDPAQGLFLAMEMVDGKDLSNLLQTGLLPIPLVIHLITEVLRGLGYAHNLPIEGPNGSDGNEVRGLVHRDVSPHNVLLSWEGAVKVSDFGIAKARVASNASASVVIKGKPAYMSPEQVNGKPLDGRSDLFAVGIMLWEMLIGRTLFGGDGTGTVEQMFAAVFFAEIVPPRDARPDVPADLSQITMRLLQRDLDQRYATAEDAIRDLLACRDAPRNGGAELTDTLQARFPGQKPARTSRARAAAQPVRDKLVPPGAKPGLRSGQKLGLIVVAVVVAAAVATLAVVTLTGNRAAPTQIPANPSAAKAIGSVPAAAPIEPLAPKASTEAAEPSAASAARPIPSRTDEPRQVVIPASSRTRPPKAKGSAKAHSLTPPRNALDGDGK